MKASLNSGIRRIVLTSSFGSVLDMSRPEDIPWKYTSEDWNPITYAEAASPNATAQDAYRGSKTIAEQEAWKFTKEWKPQFDLVTLCPSMVFGPLATSPTSLRDLNESNIMLWKVASGGPSQPLPPCRFNFWIDVRDLAEIHVQALLVQAAGGKRFIPVSPEPFTYEKASETISVSFESLKSKVSTGVQEVKTHVSVDMDPVQEHFPNVKYTPFTKTVTDLISQLEKFA
jgi:nucleoside-diphosphate-sugar epimerase